MEEWGTLRARNGFRAEACGSTRGNPQFRCGNARIFTFALFHLASAAPWAGALLTLRRTARATL